MKTLLLFSIIALFFLGACETVEIEKLVFDTVYIEKPVTKFVQTVHVDTVYKELLRVDTVEVQVVVHDTVINNTIQHDTVFQIKTDSIFIETVVEKIVNHYDTVIIQQVVNHTDTIYIDKIVTIHDTVYVTEYEQRVVYLAVEYVFPFNSVTFIPTDLQKYHDEYIAEATKRGKVLIGGDVVFTYVDPKDLPVEGSVSNTFEMAGNQQIIQLSSELIQERSRAAVYREMNRWQLKKQYSNDVNKIMCPWFRTSPDPTVQEINILFQ